MGGNFYVDLSSMTRCLTIIKIYLISVLAYVCARGEDDAWNFEECWVLNVNLCYWNLKIFLGSNQNAFDWNEN